VRRSGSGGIPLRKRLHELDAVRGVAALVVAFHHLSMIYGGRGIPILPFLAVDVFFLLSGFVMARTYENRMRAGSLSPPDFVALRYRRLWLPLAVGTSLGLVLSLTQNGCSLSLIAAYLVGLAFLPAFWTANAFALNIPAWSLFLEIVSNAAHGAVFARVLDRTLAIIFCCSSLTAAILLSVGLSRWNYSIVAILSCLPRELAFYLAGILIFRRFADRPFGFIRGRWAVWLGAISYPLYATHVPLMKWAALFKISPAIALTGALAFAAGMVVLGLDGSSNHSPLIALRSARRRRGVAVPDVVNVAD
jgi:peptidoglycan/LPS O-acetylase OafA/YrhL